MKELDLAALMCSKVCHDLISPVGALANGLEVLAEEDDPEMRDHALALIQSSAAIATAKLKFARLAFGASRSSADHLDINDARETASGLLESPQLQLDWALPSAVWPKDRVRLALNMLLLGKDAIVRGGQLRIAPLGDGNDGTGGFLVEAQGPRAKLPDGIRFFDAGAQATAVEAIDDLDARAVQPFLTGLLAASLDAHLEHEETEERVVFRVRFSTPAAVAA